MTGGANSLGVETYTLSEATEPAEVTVDSLGRRPAGGALRTVKRNGVRRVPRSELERALLRVGDAADISGVVRELTDTIRRQSRTWPPRTKPAGRRPPGSRPRLPPRPRADGATEWPAPDAERRWLLREARQQPILTGP